MNPRSNIFAFPLQLSSVREMRAFTFYGLIVWIVAAILRAMEP